MLWILFVYILSYLTWTISPITLNDNGSHLATFSVKLLEFQNRGRRRMDGKCCGKSNDGLAHCQQPCSLEFLICLEPFGIPVSLTNSEPYSGPCVYGKTGTGHWGNSDVTYGVDEAPTHHINITLPWPVSLFGKF